MRAFPPRLPEQPIFYPVLSIEYARKIARNWNTSDEPSGYVGYVLRFEVDTNYLAKYQPHPAGGRDHLEYWIPAEELEEFNRHIVGVIERVESYFSDSKV